MNYDEAFKILIGHEGGYVTTATTDKIGVQPVSNTPDRPEETARG